VINVKFKARAFFDSKAVTSRVDAATRKVLSRFGAFVRASARQSIRKSKGVSVPGSPPKSHTGLLKRFIFFSYEFARRSVVIGPEKVNVRGDAILSALEKGGRTTIRNRRRRGRRTKRRKEVRIQARPFMGPALVKNAPQLPGMWRDSVTRT